MERTIFIGTKDEKANMAVIQICTTIFFTSTFLSEIQKIK